MDCESRAQWAPRPSARNRADPLALPLYRWEEVLAWVSISCRTMAALKSCRLTCSTLFLVREPSRKQMSLQQTRDWKTVGLAEIKPRIPPLPSACRNLSNRSISDRAMVAPAYPLRSAFTRRRSILRIRARLTSEVSSASFASTPASRAPNQELMGMGIV
jgi:hypothetical protein